MTMKQIMKDFVSGLLLSVVLLIVVVMVLITLAIGAVVLKLMAIILIPFVIIALFFISFWVIGFLFREIKEGRKRCKSYIMNYVSLLFSAPRYDVYCKIWA